MSATGTSLVEATTAFARPRPQQHLRLGALIWVAAVWLPCHAGGMSAPEFAVTNGSRDTGRALASASVPCLQAEAPASVPNWLVEIGQERLPAQTRSLGRYSDGSARRLLVRFPRDFDVRERVPAKLLPAQAQSVRSIAREADAHGFRLRAGAREVLTDGPRIVVRRDGRPECSVSLVGVDYPFRFLGPEVEVIEDGPYLAWVTAEQFGGHWNVIWEVKADLFGRVQITARLRRMWDEQPVPSFGLALDFPENANGRFRGEEIAPGPAGTSLWPSGVWNLPVEGAGVRTDITIPDGPQRQLGRIVAEGNQISLLRDPSLESDQEVIFHEGEERSVSIVIEAPGEGLLDPEALSVTIPRARLAEAVMEGEPVNWGAMQDIRRRATEMALAIQCKQGDQFGDVGGGGGRPTPRYAPTHLTRVYQGLFMLEDYYLGGDPRLRDFALNWAENYVTLHVYRGLDQNAFGLERYFRTAPNSIPAWNQKGHLLLIRAYEETGDPRYLEAAISTVDAICRQLKQGYFVLSYDLERRYSLSANVRVSFFCKDLVEFYQWTGDDKYLQAAQKLLRGLASLRVGEGLWKEGYYDQYNPRAHPVTGNDLAIGADISNAYKPYILENPLHGAVAVYAACQDPDAYRVMVDTADYYVRTQDEGGWWSYNQTGAPSKMVGILGTRVPDALLSVYEFTGDRKYYAAALKALRLNVNLLRTYGTVVGGIGLPGKSRWFAEDESRLDFLRSGVNIGGYSRDAVTGFVSAVNHFLRMFPGQEALLLQEPDDWKGRYLLHQAPVWGDPAGEGSRFADRKPNPINAEFDQIDELESAGDLEGAIEGLEGILARYPDSPLELWRIAELRERLGQTEETIAPYRRFVEAFPEHPRSVIARMRVAEALRLSGRSEEAFAEYRTIAEGYPDNSWAEDARLKLWLYASEGERPGCVAEAVRVDGPKQLNADAPGAIRGLIDDDSDQPYHLPAELTIGYDDENLYFRAACHSLDPLFLAPPEQRPHYYVDPEIIIYLDPQCEGWSFRMIGVTVGGRAELRGPAWGRPGRVDETGGWDTDVRMLDDGWEALITIPFDRLGANPRDGKRVWRLNFRRQHSRDTGVWRPGLIVPIMPQEFGHLVFVE